MKTVMALLEKGEREREAQEPELPADLGQLLAMVDGQRSQEELIRLNGGSATVAGGLRWLQVAGYVENRVVDEGWQDSAWITQPSSLTVRDVFTGLRNHLRAQLQQHGGAAAATYLAQVDAAQDVEQLIALSPPCWKWWPSTGAIWPPPAWPKPWPCCCHRWAGALPFEASAG